MSMSRKGCSSDNAACEGFGRQKRNVLWQNRWYQLEKFICFLDRYIRWYNEKRIKLSDFVSIFPYTFYHLTHYWYAAADIPVANDIQRTMRMPFVIMSEGSPQGSFTAVFNPSGFDMMLMRNALHRFDEAPLSPPSRCSFGLRRMFRLQSHSGELTRLMRTIS